MERVSFAVGGEGSVAFRYAVLERAQRMCGAHGVALLGFRVDTRLTLLVEGARTAIGRALHGLKTGTARSDGVPGRLGRTRRVVRPPFALHDELVALHRAEVPLESPWTSHRELLGLRDAGFVDRSVWHGRIDPRRVHLEAGGGPLPVGVPVPLAPRGRAARRAHIDRCLRVAAATLGVLPGDRRSMPLYAQLGRETRTPQIALADAVLLTPRRIRQLQRVDEPRLPVARKVLAHPAFRVP